jgi:hypothetical protein
MTNEDDEDKKELRIMWVASGLIALFIVGLMFAIGDQTPSGPTDLSSQSRTTAPSN